MHAMKRKIPKNNRSSHLPHLSQHVYVFNHKNLSRNEV